MKRIPAALLIAVLMSVFLTASVSAVIQYPPADKNVSADVYHVDAAPALDGVIGADEYRALEISPSSVSYVVGSEIDWNRVKNTYFEAYAAIYGGKFYFALKTRLPERYYITQCEPRMMWAQTCLMISLAKEGTTGRGALEIGVRPDGKSCVWQNYGNVTYSADGSFAAVYSDGEAVYEIAVPLAAFGAAGDGGFRFCFSISCGDFFNGERIAYVQFGKGISGFSEEDNAEAGKDVSIFPTVRIVGETSPITDTEDTEDSGRIPSESPDTGADLLPAVAVTLLSAVLSVCAIYSFKRETVKRLR